MTCKEFNRIQIDHKVRACCTKDNEIIINHDAVKLPFTLIDYIVVHELVHIKHKDHSKAFYREVAKYIPDWELLDEKLCGMKL